MVKKSLLKIRPITKKNSKLYCMSSDMKKISRVKVNKKIVKFLKESIVKH